MTKCQPGFFNNDTEQASCKKCAAGTFQKDKGRRGCEACKKGNYCIEGASSGTPCEAGRFGNRLGFGCWLGLGFGLGLGLGLAKLT